LVIYFQEKKERSKGNVTKLLAEFRSNRVKLTEKRVNILAEFWESSWDIL